MNRATARSPCKPQISRCCKGWRYGILRQAIRAKALTNCLDAAQTRFIWQAVLKNAPPVEIAYGEPVPDGMSVGDEFLLAWNISSPTSLRQPAAHQLIDGRLSVGGMSLFSGVCVEHKSPDLELMRDIEMSAGDYVFMAFFTIGRY